MYESHTGTSVNGFFVIFARFVYRSRWYLSILHRSRPIGELSRTPVSRLGSSWHSHQKWVQYTGHYYLWTLSSSIFLVSLRRDSNQERSVVIRMLLLLLLLAATLLLCVCSGESKKKKSPFAIDCSAAADEIRNPDAEGRSYAIVRKSCCLLLYTGNHGRRIVLRTV